jgi:hypothetical protein
LPGQSIKPMKRNARLYGCVCVPLLLFVVMVLPWDG